MMMDNHRVIAAYVIYRCQHIMGAAVILRTGQQLRLASFAEQFDINAGVIRHYIAILVLCVNVQVAHRGFDMKFSLHFHFSFSVMVL